MLRSFQIKVNLPGKSWFDFFLDQSFPIHSELTYQKDCMNSVRIRSFSAPYFPAFRLNTERYEISVFSPNAGKYGPEKLRIPTLFTQWKNIVRILFRGCNVSWESLLAFILDCVLVNFTSFYFSYWISDYFACLSWKSVRTDSSVQIILLYTQANQLWRFVEVYLRNTSRETFFFA